MGRGNNWNEREEDLLVVDKTREGAGEDLPGFLNGVEPSAASNAFVVFRSSATGSVVCRTRLSGTVPLQAGHVTLLHSDHNAHHACVSIVNSVSTYLHDLQGLC